LDLPDDRATVTTLRVLTVNAGSSSLKLGLLNDVDTSDADREEQAELEVGATGIDVDELDRLVSGWAVPDAVGHRVVHGGTSFTQAVRITPQVEDQLRELTDLAPLHQPKSLAALDAVSRLFPQVPAVACFDTAFHATIPPAAATYAVPREWRDRYGIRRYGFHGLSHAYCSRRAAQIVGRPLASSRIVTAHLGAGASLAAVLDGRSVDTTMGFTPLEGLVMATRSGSVDPGLVLWLEEHEHLAPHQVAAALEHQSGLLALTGSADMRAVEAAVDRGDPDAQLGLDVYIHRLVAGIAAMTAALGGVDVLAFTGGTGEHSSRVRRLAADRLGHLGVAVGARNDEVSADVDVSAADATARTVVISAREDLQIARETRNVLA
jgi:acetate kinase